MRDGRKGKERKGRDEKEGEGRRGKLSSNPRPAAERLLCR